MGAVLDIEKLKINFYTYEGVVQAIDEISFVFERGDTLAVVGETGCGKSVTALSLLGLIMEPGRIEGGKILFGDPGSFIDLAQKSDEFMRRVRGNDISMIFQEPGNALNPVLTIGDQVSESFLLHRQAELCESVLASVKAKADRKGRFTPLLWLLRRRYRRTLKLATENRLRDRRYGRLLRREALHRSIEILRDLGIPNPGQVVKRYPHVLSGGMQQRVVISMALACNPTVLIADEPTSNLDVTIQAQILRLIEELKARYHSSILFITHDLGVVSEVADSVIVLYAGTLVELAGVGELFKNPLHPYTRALMNSVPKLGSRDRLESIMGNVPNLIDPPSGCRFHPRCPHVMAICRDKKPKLYPGSVEEETTRRVACFLYGDRGSHE
jgi:peptide/nickel transport system ATP-binding protein